MVFFRVPSTSRRLPDPANKAICGGLDVGSEKSFRWENNNPDSYNPAPHGNKKKESSKFPIRFELLELFFQRNGYW